MEYLGRFEWTGQTVEERIGRPEAFQDVVSNISNHFSKLERLVDQFIRDLTGLEPGRPAINLVTMPFKQKVNLLASIVSEMQDVYRFNTGRISTDELFGELASSCLQAQALYRNIKRAKRGYRPAYEAAEELDAHFLATKLKQMPMQQLDPHQLLDISDYVYFVGDQLEQFFLDAEEFNPAAA